MSVKGRTAKSFSGDALRDLDGMDKAELLEIQW
jgi:hypothetical protein